MSGRYVPRFGLRGHLALGEPAARGPGAAGRAGRNIRRAKRRVECRDRGNDAAGSAGEFSRVVLHGDGLVGLLAAVLVAIAANILLAWMYVSVRASQVVAGLVFNVLALGIASTVYRRALGDSAAPESIAMFRPAHSAIRHPAAHRPRAFGQTILFYLTLVLAFVAQFVLFRTNFGLALRASGGNPAAADSAGISVSRMPYPGTLIPARPPGWPEPTWFSRRWGSSAKTIVAGQGFIALGIVIFGRWDPLKAAVAALVFGACDALQLSLQIFGTSVPPQLLLALPYVVTILAISGIFGDKAVQPAALMKPYVKE